MLCLTHFLNRDILLNASAILFVSLSAVGADKLDEPKLDKSKAKKRLRTCREISKFKRFSIFYINKVRTTKFPITTVARKNGMQDTSPTYMQSHILSIHSPHNTRNTIINECMKSVKFHRGISASLNLCTLSAKTLNLH
jgi:hypothetical protein